MKFKKGDTIIYPQHGACIVMGTKKMDAFGASQEYLILRTVINEMTLSFKIDAELWGQPVAQHQVVRTSIDVDTGDVRISDAS